ncbi:MAG: FMN-dependent NADH-azoreductase [Alphaproteobacteria bacterium]|nr:FMN-dependent NADH-azoreductase [Alphaproteobacteria bacterium]MDE1967734.1 FMN-dependent NADH-azoreductase [Alphaproteobacteria bacterium]MDE2513657.1 FMN-dependent NADH-azoreductase [Alphaproteobacteria bacterium]
MKLLHVDASILGVNSISRQLSAAIVKRLRDANPALEVSYHDLGAEPIGHLTGAHLAAAQGVTPEEPLLQQDLALGQKALEDFLAADIVVVGAPMYNFSVSSQLKAWIDRLAVRGKTFRYTDKGPEGLAGGKRVIVASSRGGFYGPQMPTASLDHQENYLRGVFGFFGIADLTFIRAEGVNVSPDQRKAAIEAATAEVGRLAA